jgi:hypothetical protein
MRQFVAISVLSVAVFSAGYGVRIWVDDHRPLPRPPGPFMGEFATPAAAAASAAASATSAAAPAAQHPWTRPDLAAKIEQYRAQMDVYHVRMGAIDAEFERNLVAVLTPEQRAHHAEVLARKAARPAHPEETQPLTDDQITSLLQRPMLTVFRNITLQMKADDLNKELKLDAAEQDQVKELLRKRREEFIALVDSVPPPSLIYMSLAPAAQRLAAPKADASAAPKP